MRFLRNMDALKLVILASLGIALVLGAWDWILYGDLQSARRSWKKAQQDVVNIHALLKEIRPLYDARQEMGLTEDPTIYFEKQLFIGGIKSDRYILGDVKKKTVTVGRRNKAFDKTLKIDLKSASTNDRLWLPRENLFKALFACEAGSKAWRLRKLRIRSRVERKKKKEPYPAEIADEWLIEELIFASREPAK